MCLLTEAQKVGYVTYVIRIMTRGCSIVTDFRGSLSGHSLTGPKILLAEGESNFGATARNVFCENISKFSLSAPTGPSDYCHAVTKGVARCARAPSKAERMGNYQYL